VTPPAAVASGPFNLTGVVKSGSRPGKFAVVYLEDAPKDPTRGMNVSIDQRMMLFVPYIAAVGVGGTATFVNSDPFPHNVFSPNGEKFDLGTLSKGGVAKRAFKTPGAYTLLCNVHPGMIGYVYVAPSSYFAVANGQGEFTIKAVPEGTYKVAAWAPKMAAPAQSVVVKGGDARVEIEINKQ
jgi:plastocyanin